MSRTQFLLDTSVVLSLLRGGKQGVDVWREYLQPSDYEPLVSVVTLAEVQASLLLSSAMKQGQRELGKFFKACQIAPIDNEIVQEFARFRAAGAVLSDNDLWLAATARAWAATLLTFNTGFAVFSKSHLKSVILGR